jgi:plastocyanin
MHACMHAFIRIHLHKVSIEKIIIAIMKSSFQTVASAAFLLFAAASSSIFVLAEDIEIAWSIRAYPNESAQVGDTITFTWASGHNVNIHPTGTCTETGAMSVGTTSPATYTFAEADVGQDLFFACDVGSHCEFEQHVTVSVTAGDSPTGATTPAPVSMPTVSPMPTAAVDAPTPTGTESGAAASELVGTLAMTGSLVVMSLLIQ